MVASASINVIATEIGRMLVEDGLHDPSFREIAKRLSQGETLAYEGIYEVIRNSRLRIQKSLEDMDILVCPVTAIYYAKFRKKEPETKQDMMSCLPGVTVRDKPRKAAEGFLLINDTQTTNKIWLAWQEWQANSGLKKTGKSLGRVDSAAGNGLVELDEAARLRQYAHLTIDESKPSPVIETYEGIELPALTMSGQAETS